MNLSDIDKFFKGLSNKPLKTIITIFIIALLGAGGIWITTFLQERAKQTSLQNRNPITIYLNEFGFKGIKDSMDRHDVRQLFGEPIEEEEQFWKYRGFGIGFHMDYVNNINYYFGEGVNWSTEDGVTKGTARQRIIEIYGTPKKAAYEGSIYYYDLFNITFNEKGIVQQIVVHVHKPDGISFSEIEDLFSNDKEDTAATE